MTRSEIVIATKNRGKVAEIRQIMEELGLLDAIDVLCLADFPDYPDVEETGDTFEENALIKARAAASHTAVVAVAEDSGIEVEALGGAPGVRSGRFAGPDATDAANNEKLLARLSGLPDKRRGARFVAVIALAGPDGRERTVRGECRGSVADAPRGAGGFGYAPLFFYPHLGKTYAEMSNTEKNKISHRRRAIEELCRVLPEFLAG
ncbi:MAG: XTP/dITP diphosphatase [Deltaproteobacteria bacterium]|nr:XTP/dITP diphosphatase [Candidatus Zymogenaceae bacterium]